MKQPPRGARFETTPMKKAEFLSAVLGRLNDDVGTILHAHSVAAITMSEGDHFKYLERVIYTAFNPKFYSHEEEGSMLAKLAELKLGADRVRKLLKP